MVSLCPYFLKQTLDLINSISHSGCEEISTFLRSIDFETFYCSIIGSIVQYYN